MTGESPLRAERDEQVMRVGGHAVVVAYDPDGEVWFIRSASLPGLSADAPTLDELVAELPYLIRLAGMP